ncbi:MAG: hypothetical protein Q9219_006085 [cf. Caloplaca sp. 3 TL-2023]
MQDQTPHGIPEKTHEASGDGRAHEDPNNKTPKDADFSEAADQADPLNSLDSDIGRTLNIQSKSHSLYLKDNTGSESAEDDSAEAGSSELPEIPVKHTRKGQGPSQDLASGQNGQSSLPSSLEDLGVASNIHVQTLKPVSSQEPILPGTPSSNSELQSDCRDFKRTFRIMIHVSEDLTKQRLCCLDTMADLDVISHHVVESLGLKKEKYEGDPIKPLGGHFRPEWQVTFDWHVAKFHKTYTSTFAVLDEKHSGDFDVLLGASTIEENGFFIPNGNVFFLAVGDDKLYPVSAVDHGASAAQVET